MNKSCCVPARGNQLFAVHPYLQKEDVYCEFAIIKNEGETFRARLDVPQVHEVIEILRAFLEAPIARKE